MRHSLLSSREPLFLPEETTTHITIEEAKSLLILILIFRISKRLKLSRSFFSRISHLAFPLHIIIFFDSLHTVAYESTSSPFLSQQTIMEFVDLLTKRDLLQLLHLPFETIPYHWLRQYCLALCLMQQLFSICHLSFYNLSLRECKFFWDQNSSLSILSKNEIASKISSLIFSHPLVQYIYQTLTLEILRNRSILASDLLITHESNFSSLSTVSCDSTDHTPYGIYRLLTRLNYRPSQICMISQFRICVYLFSLS